MKYCSRCGAPMEDADRFCSRCGAGSGFSPKSSFRPEAMGKLGCELAYCGTLFWVPLLLCPKERNARFCANQGLWVLLVSTAACVGIRLLGAANEWLAGGLSGFLFGSLYALLFVLFLGFMLYLTWNCVKNALAIHRGETPKSILFFDRIRMIPERT